VSLEKAARNNSAIRRLFAPEFPNENTKWRSCPGCGGEFLEWQGKYHRYCPDCAERRQVELGGRWKIGPDEHLRRTVIGALLHWAEEAERLGLTTTPDD
jgi:hypothetical protein